VAHITYAYACMYIVRVLNVAIIYQTFRDGNIKINSSKMTES